MYGIYQSNNLELPPSIYAKHAHNPNINNIPQICPPFEASLGYRPPLFPSQEDELFVPLSSTISVVAVTFGRPLRQANVAKSLRQQ